MRTILTSALFFLAVAVAPGSALAVKSGELYTDASHPFGRFEASIKFPQGDGIVGGYFLWKAGSEVTGTFWNELDFEKVGADCQLESNAYYGNPAVVHAQRHTPAMLLCGSYHTYAFEWTPEYLAWSVDGMELRRETGAAATAYADNATAGMQFRFNIWPGDASFGGNFDPSTLPVYEEIDWVQYSSYANGAFTLAWRDDFETAALNPRWLAGNWDSPKALSKHDVRNVGVVDGHAVLALTSDEAVGMGVPPQPAPTGGSGGGAGLGGGASVAGAAGAATAGGSAGGASNTGGALSGDAGSSVSGGAGGTSATGSSGSGPVNGSVAGSSGASSSNPSAMPNESSLSSCATTPGSRNGSGGWPLALILAAFGVCRRRRGAFSFFGRPSSK